MFRGCALIARVLFELCLVGLRSVSRVLRLMLQLKRGLQLSRWGRRAVHVPDCSLPLPSMARAGTAADAAGRGGMGAACVRALARVRVRVLPVLCVVFCCPNALRKVLCYRVNGSRQKKKGCHHGVVLQAKTGVAKTATPALATKQETTSLRG